MSIEKAKDETLGRLFEINSPNFFEIPLYQREYRWRKEEWSALWDDLIDASESKIPNYFLGTIICMEEQNKITVIDGQQRLTTLSILLLAIYNALNAIDNKIVALSDIKRYLVVGGSMAAISKMEEANWHKESPLRLRLQKDNGNNTDYVYLAYMNLESEDKNLDSEDKNLDSEDKNLDSEDKNLDSENKSKVIDLPVFKSFKHFGNRRLAKAFNFFAKRIQIELYPNTAPKTDPKTEVIIQLYRTIMQATMVQIFVKDTANALVLFESLNNRGLPLSTIDIVKSHLFSANTLSKHKNDKARDESEVKLNQQWNEILQLLDDDYQVHERFFRHCHNAFKDEWQLKNDQKKIDEEAKKNNMDSIYKVIFENAKDLTTPITQLEQYALSYRKILTLDDKVSSELSTAYRSLSQVQGSPSYLLLLYLEEKRAMLQLTDAHLTRITKLLIAFFVRRNLTDVPATRHLNVLFINIVDEIKAQKLTENSLVDFIKEEIIKSLKDEKDESFIKALNGNIYEDNQKLTSFILRSLPNNNDTLEYRGFWYEEEKKSRKKHLWSVEHILPQTQGKSDLNKEWIKMLTGDENNLAEAKNIQQEYVHKLGNLTLSGYNSELSTKPFSDKRDMREKKNKESINNGAGYIGYKNGITLNKDEANQNQWTSKEIDQRTKRLVTEILDFVTLDV